MKAVLVQNHFAVDVNTGGANYTSPAFAVYQADVIGLQFTSSGASTGTIKVQTSIDHVQDPQGNVQVAGNWVDLYFSINGGAPTNTASLPTSSSPLYIDLSGSSCPYIRVVTNFVSGSALLNGYMTYKRIGD